VSLVESWWPKRPTRFSGSEALKYRQGKERAIREIAAELGAKLTS
jgi:hypothetical protein